ncbi:cytochrome c oxidase assembly factor 4, mitochondrial [Cocos nucifera]|nr:cytochrome c oxidase assembly factor 4, mitochondrial [Cocos nucifera]
MGPSANPPTSTQSPSPAPPPLPPPLHQTDADEEDENVKQLKECSALYLALQECLVRTNRNWKSCQPEVQALKACQARRNDGREK